VRHAGLLQGAWCILLLAAEFRQFLPQRARKRWMRERARLLPDQSARSFQNLQPSLQAPTTSGSETAPPTELDIRTVLAGQVVAAAYHRYSIIIQLASIAKAEKPIINALPYNTME
jgi:hypothetical protein